jgi:hypothetical protein
LSSLIQGNRIDRQGIVIDGAGFPIAEQADWGAAEPASAGDGTVAVAYGGNRLLFITDTLDVATPTGLTAEVGGSGVTVHWQPASSGARGFLVERTAAPLTISSEWTVLNPAAPVPPGGPWEYFDASVEPGTAWLYRVRAFGENDATSEPIMATMPAVSPPFAFHPPTPNPVTPSTILAFDLPRRTRARLELFGADGRLVRTVQEGDAGPGTIRIGWDGMDARGQRLPSGIYLLRLEAEGRTEARRVAVIR